MCRGGGQSSHTTAPVSAASALNALQTHAPSHTRTSTDFRCTLAGWHLLLYLPCRACFVSSLKALHIVCGGRGPSAIDIDRRACGDLNRVRRFLTGLTRQAKNL